MIGDCLMLSQRTSRRIISDRGRHDRGHHAAALRSNKRVLMREQPNDDDEEAPGGQTGWDSR